MALKEDAPPEIALVGECDAQSRSASQWRRSLAKVIRSVVNIHFAHVQSFDTDRMHCGQATGFVVDSENGYILTNRHIVGPGPFWGYCTFSNHEEVSHTPRTSHPH